MKTLAGLDRSRTHYLLDTTVCMDILGGEGFAEFFDRVGRAGSASFLMPPAVENELGGYMHHNAGAARTAMPRVKRYLRAYGRCESKYRYPQIRSLRAATRALRAAHPALSETDAYLLHLFRRHCSHAELRLLTSDVQLHLAARKECPRCVVIDPRRFRGAGRAAQSGPAAQRGP